ncbi:hypothetical protein OPIT5_13880 [Opitutaceae bacterium TAV5]|nr:hypothetical protein OPIT5_13880 [Opitutaceae bacterium TAV5]
MLRLSLTLLMAVVLAVLVTEVMAAPAAVTVTPLPLRVAVFSPEGDRDLEMMITVALMSAHGADGSDTPLHVLERRQLDMLLGERSRQHAFATPQAAVRAGHLVRADVMLSLRRMASSGALLIETVDPQTGRILGHAEAASIAPEEVAATVRRLLATAPPAPRKPSIAVTDFDGNGFRGAAALRETLREAGFAVLDRAIIEHAVAETALARAGMVGSPSASVSGEAASSAAAASVEPALLGADYLVRGRLHDGNGRRLTLQVLGTAAGSLVAAHEFAADATPDKLAAWLATVLPEPPRRRLVPEPLVQVEALAPLYEGIARFRDGDIRSALRSFWRAQELDDKFQEALEWEARCYDALGLPRLAAALRRYSRECLVGRGISVPSRNVPVDGITFLGIQGATPALEMQAVNALIDSAPGRIVLPDHLSAYRHEYDALAGGVTAPSAAGWTRAPGFLTRWSLRASFADDAGGNDDLRWTLFDTLTGRIAATARSTGPEDFPSAVLLADAEPASDRAVSAAIPFGPRDAAALRRDIVSSIEPVANLAIVELLASDPTSPDLWGRRFKRGGDERGGIAGFLNFALHEHLLTVLPDDNPQRPWLELAQLEMFLPYEQRGLFFSGEMRDPLRLLRDFIARHPGADDAPGALARYMLLYETIAITSSADLVRLSREAEHCAFQAAESEEGKKHSRQFTYLKGMARHLRILAEVAADNSAFTASLEELPGDPDPVRTRPELRPDGALWFSQTSWWFANEWRFVAAPRKLWRQEAIAALHILGRRTNTMKVPSAWIEESPDSITLLNYAIKSLHEVDHGFGTPFAHPFDMDAERAAYLRTVDYCERGLLDWLGRASDAMSLKALHLWSSRCIWYLSRYAFADSLSDARALQIKQNLIGAIDRAKLRLGDNNPYVSTASLQAIPRRMPVEIWSVWRDTPDHPVDFDDLVDREAAAAGKSFAGDNSPAAETAWWRLMGQWEIQRLRPEKQAELAMRHAEAMRRIFPDSDAAAGALGPREAAFIHNYAFILYLGRRYADAEPWFRMVADLPENDLMRTHTARELRESARVYLAACLVPMGREDEALRLARACVEIPEPPDRPPYRLLGSVSPRSGNLSFDGAGPLKSAALRLMRDLRLAAAASTLPENIRAFLVPIKDGNGARSMFFLRIPPDADEAAAASRPVLVLVPSLWHGGEEYMEDANSWARYADRQGMFLLVPEFNWASGEGSGGLRFWYHDAQNWSGEALLTALGQVAREHPAASTGRVLLHGYGGGGQFVQCFVRWAPERTQAVSIHSAGNRRWLDGMPRMKPFSALRDIPMLLTCGERDDRRDDDRLDVMIQYATAALGGGVDVTWKVLPETGHTPTGEMETLAQEFLAGAARTPRPPAAAETSLVGLPERSRLHPEEGGIR